MPSRQTPAQVKGIRRGVHAGPQACGAAPGAGRCKTPALAAAPPWSGWPRPPGIDWAALTRESLEDASVDLDWIRPRHHARFYQVQALEEPGDLPGPAQVARRRAAIVVAQLGIGDRLVGASVVVGREVTPQRHACQLAAVERVRDELRTATQPPSHPGLHLIAAICGPCLPGTKPAPEEPCPITGAESPQ
jgi:hypothetical protein